MSDWNKSKKRLIENALSMGVVQLVSLGLPLLSLPYIASVLGAEQLGRMAFALSVAQILYNLTDYGFNLSAPKLVSVNRHNPQKVADIWSAVTLVKTLMALIGLMLVCISSLFFDRVRNDLVLFIIAYVMVLGNVMYPQWLFQGLERLKVISIVQLVARVIVFGLIFLLVRSKTDIYWATFLQAGGYLVGGILALPLTIKTVEINRLRWPSWNELISQLKDGRYVFLSTASMNIYVTSNSFFLGIIVNPTMLAYYYVAEKLIRALQSLYGPISNAVYPHVSRLSISGANDVLLFNKKLLLMSCLVALILSVFLLLLAPLIIVLFFGEVYLPAAGILQIFSLLPIIVVSSNVFGILTMLPLGFESVFSRIYFFAAVINLFVFIPVAIWFGAIGAAWANVAIELFVALSMGWFLYRIGISPIRIQQKLAP